MLILRLQTPDDPEPAWALLSGASTEWAHGTWDKLLPLARGQQQVVLLIPSREVLLTHTTINTRNQRQLKQAIPYALEDAIADDPENQHIVWQMRGDTSLVDAAIIDRERLREWVAALQKHQLRANAILPDVFALPWEADTVTLWQQGEQTWLRTTELGGFACNSSALPLVLESLRAGRETPQRVRLYSDQPSAWAEGGQFEIIPEIHAEQLHASSLQSAMPLNLLRGLQDETNARLRQQWQRWKQAAVLAGAAILLGAGWFGTAAYHMNRQVAELHAENQRLFAELFPNATGSVDDPASLKVLLDSELAGLHKKDGNGGAGSPLASLASFAEAFASSSGLTLEDIHAQAGELSVNLQAQDQQAVDKLRETLETALGKTIELKSSRTADTIKASLTLGGTS
jgi:type II secretion system protein L